MKLTKKRVEAEKLLKKLGKRFKTQAENVTLYEMLNQLEYRWTSELGKWETFDDWFERRPKITGVARVRVIAEPHDLNEVLAAVKTGISMSGWVIADESQPYDSSRNPKYRGNTSLRVYLTCHKTGKTR